MATTNAINILFIACSVCPGLIDHRICDLEEMLVIRLMNSLSLFIVRCSKLMSEFLKPASEEKQGNKNENH